MDEKEFELEDLEDNEVEEWALAPRVRYTAFPSTWNDRLNDDLPF